MDPYRMPSLAALDRGTRAAAAILDAHREASGGEWPETVAVNLWGLDAIKTKGESGGWLAWAAMEAGQMWCCVLPCAVLCGAVPCQL